MITRTCLLVAALVAAFVVSGTSAASAQYWGGYYQRDLGRYGMYRDESRWWYNHTYRPMNPYAPRWYANDRYPPQYYGRPRPSYYAPHGYAPRPNYAPRGGYDWSWGGGNRGYLGGRGGGWGGEW